MDISKLFSSGLLWAIVGLIFTFIVVYNIAIRTNKVSGTLSFIDGDITIAEFNLYTGTNWRVIGRRELSRYPQLMLKRLRVFNSEKRIRAASNTGFGDEASEVIVEAITSNDVPLNIRLSPKTPAIYYGETFAQMVYEPVE